MKNTGKEIITSIKEHLEKVTGHITLVSHENPDGDAIGSAVGLAEILSNKGHDVTVILPNNFPQFLKWFSSELKILIYCNNKNKAKRILENSDILFCLDFNDASRAGDMKDLITGFKKTKILIDHHPHPTDFCDLTVSEPHYSSTAELIFDLVCDLDMKQFMDKTAAEALYTGLMTDTGSFSHNISRPNTFKVVANLIETGISPDYIQSKVYHNYSESRMRLLGYCLNEKMEVFPELRTAFISISKKELEEFNYQTGDTEGFVNYPLSINNVVFSALFIEKDDHVKASFRSKGTFPVNEFSRNHFSGGGHLNAAGGEARLSFDETLKKFRQLLDEYKHHLKNVEL